MWAIANCACRHSRAQLGVQKFGTTRSISIKISSLVMIQRLWSRQILFSKYALSRVNLISNNPFFFCIDNCDEKQQSNAGLIAIVLKYANENSIQESMMQSIKCCTFCLQSASKEALKIPILTLDQQRPQEWRCQNKGKIFAAARMWDAKFERNHLRSACCRLLSLHQCFENISDGYFVGRSLGEERCG